MTEIRLKIQCAQDENHAKILRADALKLELTFQGQSARRMMRFAGEMICGTSGFYIHKPGALSPVGRCARCGGELSYTVEELSYTVEERK